MSLVYQLSLLIMELFNVTVSVNHICFNMANNSN